MESAGSIRKIIADGLARRPPRKPTPDQLRKLEDEPELSFGAGMIARAYVELSTEKTYHFSGRNPIPWTAMIDWCHFNRLDYQAIRTVVTTLGHMDAIYMTREVRDRKDPKDPKDPKTPRTKGRR